MAKQLHYIVYVHVDDDGTATWEVDEGESPSLPGWVWDDETDEWSNVSDDITHIDVSMRWALTKALDALTKECNG